MNFEKTKSTEIKSVTKFFIENGEFLHKCPHCDRIRGIENEFGNIQSLSGEQYQDNLCDGWYEVSNTPKIINDVDKL